MLGIPKTQFKYLIMSKKKEEKSMDNLVVRRGNKIPTEGDTETKCETESEGKTIQRLPH